MNFKERLLKLAMPFLNTIQQKGFLFELDLEIDYWKSKYEKCNDIMEKENTLKKLDILEKLRNTVQRDPKGLEWGYLNKQEKDTQYKIPRK